MAEVENLEKNVIQVAKGEFFVTIFTTLGDTSSFIYCNREADWYQANFYGMYYINFFLSIQQPIIFCYSYISIDFMSHK